MMTPSKLLCTLPLLLAGASAHVTVEVKKGFCPERSRAHHFEEGDWIFLRSGSLLELEDVQFTHIKANRSVCCDDYSVETYGHYYTSALMEKWEEFQSEYFEHVRYPRFITQAQVYSGSDRRPKLGFAWKSENGCKITAVHESQNVTCQPQLDVDDTIIEIDGTNVIASSEKKQEALLTKCKLAAYNDPDGNAVSLAVRPKKGMDILVVEESFIAVLNKVNECTFEPGDFIIINKDTNGEGEYRHMWPNTECNCNSSGCISSGWCQTCNSEYATLSHDDIHPRYRHNLRLLPTSVPRTVETYGNRQSQYRVKKVIWFDNVETYWLYQDRDFSYTQCKGDQYRYIMMLERKNLQRVVDPSGSTGRVVEGRTENRKTLIGSMRNGYRVCRNRKKRAKKRAKTRRRRLLERLDAAERRS